MATNRPNLNLNFENLELYNEDTGSGDTGLSALQKWQRNFEKVALALQELIDSSSDLEELDKYYLRKDKDDVASGIITFLKGLVSKGDFIVGKEGFLDGLLGYGAKIGADGRAEMRSLKLWESLFVPNLVFNEVHVFSGLDMHAPGMGTIKAVKPDIVNGVVQRTGTAWLKLNKGEYGAIELQDGALGIWHFEGDGKNSTVEQIDDIADIKFKGFATSYFRITEISGENHNQFRYVLRDGFDIHPQPEMNFAVYNNPDRVDRQTCVYMTREYTRMMWKMTDWDVHQNNVAMQFGKLDNLTIYGINGMTGYSAFLNSVYFTGTVKQMKPDGTEVKVINYIEFDWFRGFVAKYYDAISHNGSMWLCINTNGTNTEPSTSDTKNWKLMVEAGSSITSYPRWESSKCPYEANSILNMAGHVVISKTRTSTPPFPLIADKNHRYICQKNGRYIIARMKLNPQWTELLDISGVTNGEDGKSLVVRYSADKVNWHSDSRETDVWMQMKMSDGDWGEIIRIAGEGGAPGKDGLYHINQFAKNTSISIPPTSGWQDAPIPCGPGEYIWFRTGVVTPPDKEPKVWSTPVRLKGEKGDKGAGYNPRGAWSSKKMPAKKMDVFTMGGSTFVCTKETSKAPFQLLCDKNGRRICDKNGRYIRTNVMNTECYDLMVTSGSDGADGKDHEFIFFQSKTETKPPVPQSVQKDDYVPAGWTDDSIGTTEDIPFEFVSKRVKIGKRWSTYSTPAIFCRWSEDSIYAELSNVVGVVQLTDKGVVIKETIFTTFVKFYNGKKTVPLSDIVIESDMPGLVITKDVTSGRIDIKVSRGYSIGNAITINFTIKAMVQNKLESRKVAFCVSAVRNGKDGEPGQPGKPGKPGDKGEQGIQGVVVRTGLWFANNSRGWFNESNLVDVPTTRIRYMDVVFRVNNYTVTGYDAFRCHPTSDGSPRVGLSTFEAEYDAGYWDEASQFDVLMASLILAKNAKIKFIQGNQLLITKADGETITVGISGGEDASDLIRIWAGAQLPGDAPFQVHEDGSLKATKADITGSIKATSGKIAGFNISGSSITNQFAKDKYDDDAAIIFRNHKTGSIAAMGSENILPGTLGYEALAIYCNRRVRDWVSSMSSPNVGLVVGATGSNENIALKVEGGCIDRFALKTQTFGFDQYTQTSNPTGDLYQSILIGTGSVLTTTGYQWRKAKYDSQGREIPYSVYSRNVRVTLPNMKNHDDGHIVKIKRGPNEGKYIYVTAGFYYRRLWNDTYNRWDEIREQSIILYDNGDYAETISFDHEGYASEFVFHRDMIVVLNGRTYYGVWVQYKCPRAW